MPLFEFRLEAADKSGHFRRGRIEADDVDQARMFLEQREIEYVLFRLGGGEDSPAFGQGALEIADLENEHGSDVIQEALAAPPEAKMPGGLPPEVRAKLAFHRQDKPYKIVKLEEVV